MFVYLLKLIDNFKKNQMSDTRQGSNINPSILLAKEDKANIANSFTLGFVSL